MSTNLNYKQVANVERRTWDTEIYEKRAKERLKATSETTTSKKKKHKTSSGESADNTDPSVSAAFQSEQEQEQTKEEFVPAAPGAAKAHKSQRAFLKARSHKVDVDSKIGSVEIVNPDAAATTKSIVQEPGAVKDTAITKTGIGWHCKVCDCFLRDSHTYLDHINGRKHQKNLGYSMRVERSTKDQVSSRLEALAKEKETASAAMNAFGDDDDENDNYFDNLVKAKDEEARRKKEERARKRKERKKEKKQQQQSSKQQEEEQQQPEDGEGAEEKEVEEGGVDPALAAMMGFSGFGGGNKNH